MAPNDNENRSYRDLFLFFSGLGTGGFLAAVLFAFAITGGFVHLT
jgi:hypothetical protein